MCLELNRSKLVDDWLVAGERVIYPAKILMWLATGIKDDRAPPISENQLETMDWKNCTWSFEIEIWRRSSARCNL